MKRENEKERESEGWKKTGKR